jgi:hypothetical protein
MNNSIFPKGYDKKDKIQAVLFAVGLATFVGFMSAFVFMVLGRMVGCGWVP